MTRINIIAFLGAVIALPCYSSAALVHISHPSNIVTQLSVPDDPLAGAAPVVFNFTGLAPADGINGGRLRIIASGDIFQLPNEIITVTDDDSILGAGAGTVIFNNTNLFGTDDNAVGDTHGNQPDPGHPAGNGTTAGGDNDITFTPAEIQSMAVDGSIEFTMTPSAQVNLNGPSGSSLPDFTIAAYLSYTTGGGGGPIAVPEPSTFFLGLLAFLTLAISGRCWRK